MSKIALDLKDFKHIKSDKNTTTLRHKGGHELIVAHKAMSPEAKAQLEALAEPKMAYGGETIEERPHPDEYQEEGVHPVSAEFIKKGQISAGRSKMGRHVREGDAAKAKQELIRVRNEAHSQKPDIKGLAEGGETDTSSPPPQPDPQKAKDFIKGFQEGGTQQDTEQSAENRAAEDAARFDDGGEVPQQKPNRSTNNTLDYKQLKKEYKEKNRLPDAQEEMRRKKQSPELQKLAEGGNIYPPCLNPNCKSYGKSHPNCRCYSGGSQYAEGGKVESHHYCTSKGHHDPRCEYHKGGEVRQGYEEGGEAKAPDVAGAIGPGYQSQADTTPPPNDNPPPPSSAQQQDTDDTGPMSTPADVNQAAAQGDQGAQNELDQEKAPSSSDASLSAPASVAAQVTPSVEVPIPNTPAARMAVDMNQLNSRDTEWQQDLKDGHINPETLNSLFAKKDTPSKIMTLFGLLVSGAGSGLAHQSNAVLDAMNQTIRNDLDAQKQSKTNAFNYNNLLEQHFRDETERGHLTTLDALSKDELKNRFAARGVQAQIFDNINKLPPGPQRDAQMRAFFLMSNSMDNLYKNQNAAIAARQEYFRQQEGGGAQMGPPANQEANFQNRQRSLIATGDPNLINVAKTEAARHVPGFSGQASDDMSESDKRDLTNMVDYNANIQRVLNFAKAHANSGPWDVPTKNQGRVLAANLTAAYRKATHGGVYKAGEQDFIDKIVPEDPTAFFTGTRVVPKLQALMADNNANLQQAAKDRGLGQYVGTNQQQQPQTQSVPQQYIDYVNRNANTNDPQKRNIVNAMKKKYGI